MTEQEAKIRWCPNSRITKTVLAHTITFPELMKSKDPVVDLQGRLIGGPDRSSDDEMSKWHQWRSATMKAMVQPGVVPPRVTAFCSDYPSYASYKKSRDIEEALIVESQNSFIPPRFTWSYTSMQEFLTCPAQWAAKRYFKTIKDVESESMRVGDLIHETAEHYLKRAVGQKFELFKIHDQYLPYVQKYCDALVASGAELQMEKEMCFDAKMKLSSWWAKDVWVRAKGDVLAKKLMKLSICDWKSGKYKEDFLQLKLFAVLAALTPGYEDVQEFDPKFIFTKEAPPKNILRLPEPIKRTELKPVLAEILGVVRRMEQCWQNEEFQEKRNGLCKKYCANKSCVHCGGGK